jgi:hypothetical protein
MKNIQQLIYYKEQSEILERCVYCWLITISKLSFGDWFEHSHWKYWKEFFMGRLFMNFIFPPIIFEKHSCNFICNTLKNKSSCLKGLKIRIWTPIIVTWVWKIFSPPAICTIQPSTKPPAQKLVIIKTKSCRVIINQQFIG